LNTLEELKVLYDVKVYGFCLMTNDVHLILQPGDSVAGMGQLMKRLAGRQTRFVNRQEFRTGTLWESRYKSSPVDTDPYLLACCCYVELNPARAGMVGDPAEYRWSSYHRDAANSGKFPWVDIDPCYEGLGATEELRSTKYRGFVTSAIPHGEWDLIRESIQREQLTGSQRFVDQVEAIIGRRIEHRKQGRPRKDDEK
jgi:putative transposase